MDKVSWDSDPGGFFAASPAPFANGEPTGNGEDFQEPKLDPADFDRSNPVAALRKIVRDWHDEIVEKSTGRGDDKVVVTTRPNIGKEFPYHAATFGSDRM